VLWVIVFPRYPTPLDAMCRTVTRNSPEYFRYVCGLNSFAFHFLLDCEVPSVSFGSSQDSLGGNCHTTIIATLSPIAANLEDSISTVQFADRARHVHTKVHVNEVVDDSILLARALKTIAQLKKQLAEVTSDRCVGYLWLSFVFWRSLTAVLCTESPHWRRKCRN
jgi:hypothetical protein